MAVTGVIYLVGSFAALFAPSASSIIEPFYVICLVVEVAFAIRLVTRGLATPTDATTRRPVTVAA
jgi:tetrahydromethanopterin S-methyltransferase subunit C